MKYILEILTVLGLSAALCGCLSVFNGVRVRSRFLLSVAFLVIMGLIFNSCLYLVTELCNFPTINMRLLHTYNN